MPIATADLNGIDPRERGDPARSSSPAFIAGDIGQADLDAAGTIGSADLSVWLGIYSGGGSLATPSPLCP